MQRSTALSRRAVLISSACGPFAAQAATASLRVVVHYQGETMTFDAADAQDLGSFTSPAGFTQQCLRAVHPRTPLTVMFRPDTGTDRVEVVFELGRLWSGAPGNLGPYRAEIMRGQKTLAHVDVPGHFWFGRWRWKSAERPVVARIADLRAQGLIPPYARKTETFFARAKETEGVHRYRPMELAGVFAKMGATGERADIGLMTEHQARYIVTENADALANVRAQAEAAGTLPWHIRDERAGAPVDLDRYATMSWYSDRSVADPHIALTDTGIRIDSAHQPALAYLPYLLTGDPYHLEDLQFAANFNRGTLPPRYRLSIPQPRAFAWSLRTLAQAAKVTPEKVPSWLLPARYFRSDLDRTRAWFEKTYVSSPDPLHAVFRATDNPQHARDEAPKAPGGTWIAPWQHEFLVAVLGWLVLMGLEEWRESLVWALGGTLARTSGKTGWSRSRPSPYRLILKPDKNSPVERSWDDAWRLSRDRARWNDADDLVEPDPTYSIYTRGALALAVRAGIKDAEAPLAWMTDQLRKQGVTVPYKWRLA